MMKMQGAGTTLLEQWDADMGMYYNRSRYYDVENGRFNAFDDWEGIQGVSVTLNKYLYGNGNPVSHIDPSGNFSLTEISVTLNLKSRQILNYVIRTERYVRPIYKLLVNLIVANNLFATTITAVNNRDLSMLTKLPQATIYNFKLLKEFNLRRSATRATTIAILKNLRKVGALGAHAINAADKGVPLKSNGLPDFYEYRHESRPVIFMKYVGGRQRDINTLNARFGKVRDYTWHHHEVLGIFELVESDKHNFNIGGLDHTGGAFFLRTFKWHNISQILEFMLKKISGNKFLDDYSIGEETIEPFGTVNRFLSVKSNQEVSAEMLKEMASFELIVRQEKNEILSFIYENYKVHQENGELSGVPSDLDVQEIKNYFSEVTLAIHFLTELNIV